MLQHISFVVFASFAYATATASNDTVSSGANESSNARGGETPPLLRTPTWTVPAAGSGTSYAQACNSESAIYDTILSYGITPSGTEIIETTSWVKTTSYEAETTRLCDGRLRVLGSLTPVHVGSVLSANMPTLTYSGPAPSCTILPSDCAWLQSSYISAESSFTSSLSRYPDAAPGDSPEMPRCYVSDLPNTACGQCTIHGNSVQLLYFPITTKTSRDMCATAPASSVICPFGPTHSNNDTISGYHTEPCPYIDRGHATTTDSGPSTVINGTTLYSNRAYISYDTLYATDSCGQVGNTYANGLVTVASSDVYSVSGYHFFMSHAAYSFNFADLSGPVPASAYLCQANCGDSGSPLEDGDVLNGVPGGGLGFCSTIIDEVYRPRLAVPPQMRGLDPAFKNCLLGLDGLYDPPRLMTSEATLDVPSATGEPTSGAQPGDSVKQTVAQTTAPPTALAESLAKSSADASHDNAVLSELGLPTAHTRVVQTSRGPEQSAQTAPSDSQTVPSENAPGGSMGDTQVDNNDGSQTAASEASETADGDSRSISGSNSSGTQEGGSETATTQSSSAGRYLFSPCLAMAAMVCLAIV